MMTRGIDPGKEMREDVELGSVYTSVVCIGRGRIMRLWQLLPRGTRRAQVQNQTKYRLPSKVWWPGMNRDDEKFCRVFHDDSFSILRGCYCDV